MIFWAASLLQEHANWINDILGSFPTSGKRQLDLPIFWAASPLQEHASWMPAGINDLASYFSSSGTCQLDSIIFLATRKFESL